MWCAIAFFDAVDKGHRIEYARSMSPPVPADVFRALGDEHRLEILAFLASPDAACCANDDGVCACDVQARLRLAQATVSYHMKILQQAGLVRAEKRGRWVYYALHPEGLTVAKELCERYLAATRAPGKLAVSPAV